MIDWKMYEELTQAPGAPGYEGSVQAIMEKYLSKYADQVIRDHLGGIFGVKQGVESGPKVMVAGHMDEVSFMITKITKDGFLAFQPLGGWWSQVLLAQRVEVITRQGKRIPGVISSVPPHLMNVEKKKKLVKIEEMYIDIGAKDAEEATEFGIEPGNIAVPVCPFTEAEGGKRIFSKAWDNRFGCGLAIELLKELQNQPHPNQIFAGATVMEEVGLRGAKVAAQMIQPDLFFALECSAAGDIPGVKNGFGEIGKGVLIRIYDRTMIMQPKMRDFLLDTVEEEKIPYQFFISPGGETDAGQVHMSGEGVPSATLGICARYIHSHCTIVDKDDIEAAKAFLVALVKRLDRSTYETLISR